MSCLPCCGSKPRVSDSSQTIKPKTASAAATAQPAPPAASPAPAAQPAPATTAAMTAKIAIIYYSTYGHVEKLAKEELEGANSVEGVEATLFRIPETLPAAVLEKMHAPPKDESIPVIDVHDLPNYDGILVGVPTRYGMPAAQFKALWDATGSLWQKGALAGKAAGIFFSTASQGGGQETTALTAITQFVHHGMLFVPLGYTEPTGLQFGLDEVQGGSAYGAGTFAGPTGARQPSKNELVIARHQGAWFAKNVKKLATA